MAIERDLPFGDGVRRVRLPDGAVSIRARPSLPKIQDPEAAARAAIDAPVAGPPLRELVHRGDRIVVAFDDGCIPALPVVPPDPRAASLAAVLAVLEERGLDLRRVTLVCANALHRKWTRGELAPIVGESLVQLWPQHRLVCHDAEDPDGIVHLGETERGLEVTFNRAAFEADVLVYLNITATPMNGGWKSYAVGLSDFRSIRHHHRPNPLAKGTSVMDPHASAFPKLLREIGKKIELERTKLGRAPFFSVEWVLDGEAPARPVAVHAGAVDETHARTLSALDKEQGVDVPGAPFDTLVIGLPDRDPYSIGARAQNPILAANLALGYGVNMARGGPLVRAGGTLVAASPMRAAFDDERHPSYRELYERVLAATKDPVEAWDRWVDDFSHRPAYVHAYRHAFGFHPAHPFFLYGQTLAPRRHLGRIVFAGVEDPAVPERLGFEGRRSLDEAIAEVAGQGKTIGVLELPPLVVARVGKR